LNDQLFRSIRFENLVAVIPLYLITIKNIKLADTAGYRVHLSLFQTVKKTLSLKIRIIP